MKAQEIVEKIAAMDGVMLASIFDVEEGMPLAGKSNSPELDVEEVTANMGQMAMHGRRFDKSVATQVGQLESCMLTMDDVCLVFVFSNDIAQVGIYAIVRSDSPAAPALVMRSIMTFFSQLKI